MAPELSDEERVLVRCRLLVQRRQTEAQLASLLRTFDEMVAAADLEPPDDEHDPDGTTAYERAQVTSLAQVARARLGDLDRAIAVADEESFGGCAECGRPIGIERLLAVPGVRHCVRCAATGR